MIIEGISLNSLPQYRSSDAKEFPYNGSEEEWKTAKEKYGMGLSISSHNELSFERWGEGIPLVKICSATTLNLIVRKKDFDELIKSFEND